MQKNLENREKGIDKLPEWVYNTVTRLREATENMNENQEDITMTNAKRFYAVQIGNDYSSDWGSTRKREAIVMAHQAARENPGKEIRISICTTDDDFCEREIVIREGSLA